jgi:DNA-binding MarR family transcriptional regulator
MQLHYKGACGMSQISERFDVSAAAASQLVDKLVQAGYIERTEDPSDRRAKLLKLSTNGAKLVDDGIQERYRWMDELTSKLSAAEQTKISEALSVLTRLRKNSTELNEQISPVYIQFTIKIYKVIISRKEFMQATVSRPNARVPAGHAPPSRALDAPSAI